MIHPMQCSRTFCPSIYLFLLSLLQIIEEERSILPPEANHDSSAPLFPMHRLQNQETESLLWSKGSNCSNALALPSLDSITAPARAVERYDNSLPLASVSGLSILTPSTNFPATPQTMPVLSNGKSTKSRKIGTKSP